MLTVRLLGGFEVQWAGQRVDIPSRAAQTLLAYLLLPPGRVHRRERLAGLLWPEAAEATAHKNLRQALYLLNKALEPAGDRLVGADRVNVWVDVRGLSWLDVAVLEQTLPPDAPVEALAEQARVYAGELLPGFYNEWLVVERERLEARFEQLMINLLQRLAGERRWAEVLEWGQRWIGLGHVPEVAYRAVMRAYAALGQPGSATLAYQRCQAALREHLGLEPSEETRALYQQIIRAAGMDEPALAPPAPAQPEVPATAAAVSESPYKGLQSFTEADAALYFGRERLVGQFIDYLRTYPFLAVVGASGSGKSSLVRAGLVPALRGLVPLPEGVPPLPGSGDWVITTLTPGRQPLASLARAVAGEGATPAAVEATSVALQRDRAGLHLVGGGVPGRLLVVDQFEELFTLCHDERARRAFIHNLLYAVEPEVGPPLRVVLTLRADFYAHCAAYAELRAALENHQYFIGPMSAAELRRAIELPAQRAGLTFQPGLMDLILRDVGDEPGALPLLSHALLETWKRRRGTHLVLAGYAEAGGVRGAIARTAEHVYQNLPPAQQALARRLFLRLTELGEGTEATRRRAAYAELPAEEDPDQPMARVLQVLAETRLITLGEDTVELAHEALIREWPTLQQWLAEDREGLRLHRRLAEAAAAWAALDHDPAELYRGARLAQAREWANANPELLNALEHEFLAAAAAQAEQEASERAAQSQRELETARQLAEAERARAQQAAEAARRQRRSARAFQAMFGVAVAALLAGLFFYIQLQAAVERAEANLARSEAQRLAAEADALLQSGGDAQRIALLAIRSLNIQYSPEADAVLGTALSLNYPRLRLEGHTNSLRAVAYSPDGRYLVTGANDETARLWEAATGTEVRQLIGHTAPVTGVAFSGDGRYILTGSEDGTACLWEAATGEVVRSFVGHGGQVQSVGLSADGLWVVTAGTDDTVRVWDAATGLEVARTTAATEAIALSPQSDRLLIGDKDGRAWIWDWRPDAVSLELAGHESRLISVAFSTDGRLAATAGVDRVVRVWDAESGVLVQSLVGHTASVFGVAFSPDGTQLISAGEDRIARLWDVATGRELGKFYSHSATVTDLAFAPQGERFATAGSDGVAVVWQTRLPGTAHVLAGHNGQLWNTAFSPDGRTLLTASVDKTARLWDVATGRTVRVLEGHTAELFGLAYARDGRTVLTAGFDGTLRQWEAATGAELRRFSADQGAVMAGAAISPDGQYIAGGDDHGVVYLWDGATGALLRQWTAHQSGLNLMAFSPDGRVLATTSNDTTTRLWEAGTGELLHTLEGHTAFVVAVTFTPDGAHVATAAADNTARIWDTTTGAEVRTITGHTDLVWGVSYSPDGRLLATASADGTARLWDTATGAEVRRFAGHTAAVEAVAFSPSGTLVATASDDGTARLWNIDYAETIRDLCGRLLRDLTPEERAQHGLVGEEPTCD